MVNAAAYVNMRRFDGDVVQTYSEIGRVWKDWNAMNVADLPCRIFYVIYGWFDQHPQWSKEMENKYTELNKIQYEKEDLTIKLKNNKHNLDTISMLFTIVKNDHVKMINKKKLKTHQYKITITIRDRRGSKSNSKKKK